ncbi:hypothetical protein NYP07_23885, partial [Pelomonas aquatica]
PRWNWMKLNAMVCTPGWFGGQITGRVAHGVSLLRHVTNQDGEWSAMGITMHGVAGCVTSVAAGGKCGPGALSAAFSQAALPYKPNNIIGGTIASYVIGGTASELGGGKFANGAITASMGYLFNAVQHDMKTSGGYGAGSADGDHYYVVWTQLSTNCDAACVQAWSNAANLFSYPSLDLRATPADTSGRPTVVYGPFPGSDLSDPSSYETPGGRVVQSRNADGSITNTTLGDHVFCCGTITRSLVLVGDSLYMMTVGTGYNVLLGTGYRSTFLANWNSSSGQQIFKTLDQQLINYKKGHGP